MADNARPPAMSYGLYPFCVQEEKAAGTHLIFRRVAGPADPKDRQQRHAEAAEALAALQTVRAYHATLPSGAEELYVQPNNAVRCPGGCR